VPSVRTSRGTRFAIPLVLQYRWYRSQSLRLGNDPAHVAAEQTESMGNRRRAGMQRAAPASASTDEVLPLSIKPAPSSLVRVLVGRAEYAPPDA
jgi:hypothetical protein